MTNHACPSAEDIYNGVVGIVSRTDIEEGELVADFEIPRSARSADPNSTALRLDTQASAAAY
jgi:hypothetical protein